MARPLDPFTSENARVADPSALSRAMQAQLETAAREVGKVYGPAGVAEWKKYIGTPGIFRAGFKSPYGFHIRGTSETSAQEAATRAIAAHNRTSDPTSEFPDPMTSWEKRTGITPAQRSAEQLRASSCSSCLRGENAGGAVPA